MDPNLDSTFWPRFQQLVLRLRGGRYWTERRDACEELGRVARQALFRVRQAAEDPDPDIAHWARQALTQLQTDSHDSIADLAALFDHDLTAEKDAGSGGKTDSGAPAPPAAKSAPPAAAAADNAGEEVSAQRLLDRLRQFAAQVGGQFQPRSGGAQIELALKEGRRQTIFLDLSQTDDEGRPAALFYSICGEAAPDKLAWALEANARLMRGALGVIRHGERNVVIMLLRRPLERLVLDDLPGELQYLAAKADWAESKLSAVDRH